MGALRRGERGRIARNPWHRLCNVKYYCRAHEKHPRTSSSSAPAWSARPAPTTPPAPASTSPSSTAAPSRAARPAPARATCWSPTRSPAPNSTSRCCPPGCGGSWPSCSRRQIEYEPKGGLVVASGEAGMRALRDFAAGQRKAGVQAEEVPGGPAARPGAAPGPGPGRGLPLPAGRAGPCRPWRPRTCCARAAGAVRLQARRGGHRPAHRRRRTGTRGAYRPPATACPVRGQRRRHLGRRAGRGSRASSFPSCPAAASSSSPSRCRAWSGTRSTPPTMSPTSPAARPRCRPRPWSRAPRRARS